MSNLLIVFPELAESVTANGDWPEAFETPDPKDLSVGVTSVTLDFGGARDIDTVVVPYATAGGVTATASGGLGSGTFVVSSDGTRRHALIHKADGPVSMSSLTVTFSSGISAGVVCAGYAFKPTWDKEKGWGRRVIDTSVKRRLIGGGFGVGRGVKVPGLAWTFGDLTDAERKRLWRLMMQVGESDPVCVVEDADAVDDLGDGIHYGPFARLDAFERQHVDINRWSLAMEGWG